MQQEQSEKEIAAFERAVCMRVAWFSWVQFYAIFLLHRLGKRFHALNMVRMGIRVGQWRFC